MNFLQEFIFTDNINSFMAISSVILFFLSIIFLGVFLNKNRKNSGFLKNIDVNIEYKITEILNIFLSSISILFLLVLKSVYFTKIDNVLGSLPILLSVIFLNIIFKMVCILKAKDKKTPVIKNIFLKIIDNFVMIITLSISASILASQITIVDISRFFGEGMLRFSLINLPFLITTLFIVLSNICLFSEYFLKSMDFKKKDMIRDFLKIIVFLIASLLITIFYVLPYNLFVILMIGVLSKYIMETLPTYINQIKPQIKKTSLLLNFLTPVSNICFSSFVGISVLLIIVFICLNYGGFYGISIASLGIVSSIILTSNLNIISHKSDGYKYIAKTLNNIALFYIFFETLEYIYKTQMNINIFSNSVIFGLVSSLLLVIFNIFKIISVIRYVALGKDKTYIAIRTSLYILFFSLFIWFILPHIDYEILGSLILGLIIITSLFSIILVNAVDVFDNFHTKGFTITPILKNTVLPLTNQITTLLIIVTILLLFLK